MSNSTDGVTGLDLVTRLQVLKTAGVSKARFNDAGDLVSVEFGSLESEPGAEAGEVPAANPVRAALVRLNGGGAPRE